MTETELEYQFCFNCNDRKNCYTKPKDCTRIKEEIGLQDMTNEEWLKSMNTEQLAEWIAKQKCDGCNDEPYDDKHGTCKYCMAIKTEQIREWLKEKHHVE